MRILWATCAVVAITLAACGKKDGEGSTASEPSTKPASAEKVAKEARGRVNCPAKISTPRPPGAPVDDIVQVRPGLTWDEAANAVMCDNPLLVVTPYGDRGFNLNTHGVELRQGFEGTFAKAREEFKGTSQQDALAAMSAAQSRRAMGIAEDPMQAGQVRYYVGVMGMPQQERVISVNREEYFAEGKSPTIDSLKQALIAKYGQPTRAEDGGSGGLVMQWAHDPTGRPITETSPLYDRCQVSVSFDAGQSVNPDCGVIVGARLRPTDNNPGLAKSMVAISLNSADAYRRLQETQAALDGGDAARQADELKNAAKAAPPPKL